MRTIVIHTQHAERSGVVLKNERVEEYVSERPELPTLTGSIFVGKVQKIDRGLQAAFVDIGESRNGFLRKDSVFWSNGKIEQAIKEGEWILVQVTKESIGDKGTQLTTDITIPGLYTVYQPFGRKLSVSRKLDRDYSNGLKAVIGKQFSSDEGCIIRTAASLVDIEVVLEELQSLKELWEKINDGKAKKNPQLLWQDPIVPDQLVRKHPLSSIKEIIVDDVGISQYLKKRYPSLQKKVSWKSDPSGYLPVSLNLIQDELTQTNIDLEQGIQLVIEYTEAMTVIDVNSRRYSGSIFKHSQAYEVNQLAASEIAKQLQLRNISGMVLIDFISMKDPSLQQRLVEYMKKQLNKDPVKSNVLGMTSLGLMEITRKREWRGPIQMLLEKPLPLYTPETILYRLERELTSRLNHSVEAVLVAVHPDLVKVKKQLLSQSISSKIPQELFVRQDTHIIGWQIELEGSLDMVREAVKSRGYHVDNLF